MRKQNATFKRDELSINHVEHNGYERANYSTTNSVTKIMHGLVETTKDTV